MSKFLRWALPLIAAAALFSALTPASAGTSSLAVSPAAQTVDDGAQFSIAIAQDASVVTSGAQVDVTFDPALLEVLSVDKGAAYATASLVIGVAPQTTEQAIAEANTTGTLQNVSAFYLPGGGSVLAGATTFVTLNMQAKANIGGVSPVTLAGAELLDAAGDPVSVTTTDGEVTVDGPIPTPTPVGQTPTPTPVPTPTASPTPEPTPTPIPDAFMMVSPASLAVPPGTPITVSIQQSANFVTTGAGADFSFDPSLLQITSVTAGTAYKKATLLYGVAPNTGAAAIAQANTTGILPNIAAFFIPGSGSIPAGQTIFVNILMTAGSTQGTSPTTISKLEMLNGEGESLNVGGTNGAVTIDVNAPAPTPLGAEALPSAGGAPGGALADSLFPLAVASGLLAAGAAVVWWGRRKPQE